MQQEQIRMQQEQLDQYEINLQTVADQVRAQGQLLEAQARLYQLDRARTTKPPAAEGDHTLKDDDADVPEPPDAHQDQDDDSSRSGRADRPRRGEPTVAAAAVKNHFKYVE